MNRSDIIKLDGKKLIGAGLSISLLVSVLLFIIFKPSNKEFNGNKKGDNETYYVIKFDSNGGSSISDMKVKANDRIKLPKEPTREGYTFANWYDEEENVVSDDTVIKSDMTLKAKWIKKESKIYTVTFNTNGGSAISPMKVSEDEPLKLPKKPTKEGYTFVNWVDQNDLVVRDGVQVSKDMTIYVEWKETYICDAGFKKVGKKCVKTVDSKATVSCTNGELDEEDGVCLLAEKDPVVDVICPKGFEYDNNICTSTIGLDAEDGKCADNYVLVDGYCYEQSEAHEEVSCPSGTAAVKGGCYQTEKVKVEYSCQKGFELSDDDETKCEKTIL